MNRDRVMVNSKGLLIKSNSIVYIACPGLIATGGPEALHQLGYELRRLGMHAYMYYVNSSPKTYPVHKNYEKYKVPYCYSVYDHEDNFIVVPEIYGNLLKSFTDIKKLFWWLSVDNYRTNNPVDFSDETIYHLAQSQYAMEYIRKKNLKHTMFLKDYLRDEYTIADVDFTSKNRRDIVLYNPSKGLGYTREIISRAPDIEFVPIQGLSPEQVRNLLLTSKVYIDFGHHPGKDRFPRESALMGNIVITNKKGAAFYDEDVPLPNGFKIEDTSNNIDTIIRTIRKSLSNYDNIIKDFQAYRDFIMKDRENFIADIEKIFIKNY